MTLIHEGLVLCFNRQNIELAPLSYPHPMVLTCTAPNYSALRVARPISRATTHAGRERVEWSAQTSRTLHVAEVYRSGRHLELDNCPYCHTSRGQISVNTC